MYGRVYYPIIIIGWLLKKILKFEKTNSKEVYLLLKQQLLLFRQLNDIKCRITAE